MRTQRAASLQIIMEASQILRFRFVTVDGKASFPYNTQLVRFA